jgi:hypothetical protein
MTARRSQKAANSAFSVGRSTKKDRETGGSGWPKGPGEPFFSKTLWGGGIFRQVFIFKTIGHQAKTEAQESDDEGCFEHLGFFQEFPLLPKTKGRLLPFSNCDQA